MLQNADRTETHGNVTARAKRRSGSSFPRRRSVALAELTIAAASVVASILEWPTRPAAEGVARTLQVAAKFHRLKNAQRQSKTAQEAFARFEKVAKAVSGGKAPATNAAKALVKARENGVPFFGEPTQDSLSAATYSRRSPGSMTYSPKPA